MRHGKHYKNSDYSLDRCIMRCCSKKADTGIGIAPGTHGRCDDTDHFDTGVQKCQNLDGAYERNCRSFACGIGSGNKNGRNCNFDQGRGRILPGRKRGWNRSICRAGRRKRGTDCLSPVDRKCTFYDSGFAIKRFCLLFVVMSCLFTENVGALEQKEILRSQVDALDLENLVQAAQEFAPDIDWLQTPDLDEGLTNILETGAESLNGVLHKALRSGVLLLVVVLLAGLAEGTTIFGSGKTLQAVSMAAALAVTAVAVSDANVLIGLGGEVIEKMEVFSKVLLPTVAAATAASGSPAAAAARQMAAMLFSDVLMTLINRLLLPLVYAYIAACTAHAAIGNKGLKRIAGTLKWVVTSMLTAVLIAFVGYLTVSGVIAGTTDAVTLKAAKFTMSSMVPVVGGILSDAAETVLASAGILKNSVGVFGMLVVLGMCLVPFLQLSIHYLTYKVVAALSATVSDSRTAGLIDDIGGAFGLILGMTGACALLLLVSMVTAVKVTGV